MSKPSNVAEWMNKTRSHLVSLRLLALESSWTMHVTVWTMKAKVERDPRTSTPGRELHVKSQQHSVQDRPLHFRACGGQSRCAMHGQRSN